MLYAWYKEDRKAQRLAIKRQIGYSFSFNIKNAINIGNHDGRESRCR